MNRAFGLLALITLACGHAVETPPETPAARALESASEKPASLETAERGPVDRQQFNLAAQRLNLPLYWVSDSNKNTKVDPEEIASLLFFPTHEEWVKDGKFTTTFDAAWGRIQNEIAAPAGADERQKLVAQELDEASPSLVSNDLRSLSESDKKFVRHMLKAGDLIDKLFAIQNGSAALASQVPNDSGSQSVFRRNWGPKCMTPKLEKNPACTAIPGAPKPLVDVYPASLQKDEGFCEALEKRPDAKKLLDPFTAVREEKGALVSVPYSEAYREVMQAIAKELHDTVNDITDPKEAALKEYLTRAAQSFTTNNWVPADEAWSRMNAENSAWYVRIAPDETYWEPCSQKAAFHLTFAKINSESLKWQDKLRPVQQEMEKLLASVIGNPYKERKVTFHLPDFIDIVANLGDDRDPIGGTIGQSLPNWGPVQAEGRGRTVVMNNLYTDVDSLAVRRKKAESLFTKESMADYSDDVTPGLLATILHEATHNLGPTHEYKYEGKDDSAAFGGDLSSMLEEFKAQSGGFFYVDFLLKKGLISPELARQSYTHSVFWGLNHIARGMYTAQKKRKPYSQLAAIQIGILLDEKAIEFDPKALAANGTDKGAFLLHLDKFPKALEKIMKIAGGIKAKNDKNRALELSKKYVDGKVVPHDVIQERALRFPQPTFVYGLNL